MKNIKNGKYTSHLYINIDTQKDK